MSSSRKIYLERDFAAGVYLSEAQDPKPPHLTHCIRVNSILIHRGEGGIDEPEKRGEGQQFTKLGQIYEHD
jgi:hypothetical protein